MKYGCSHDREAQLEGAPCGIQGCTVLICCMERWEEHKKTHPDWQEEA